jgi:hypothetical protein
MKDYLLAIIKRALMLFYGYQLISFRMVAWIFDKLNLRGF